MSQSRVQRSPAWSAEEMICLRAACMRALAWGSDITVFRQRVTNSRSEGGQLLAVLPAAAAAGLAAGFAATETNWAGPEAGALCREGTETGTAAAREDADAGAAERAVAPRGILTGTLKLRSAPDWARGRFCWPVLRCGAAELAGLPCCSCGQPGWGL